MSHDYDGTADNPRNEREREDHENVSSFPEGYADVNAGAENGCRHDELADLKEEAIRKALTDISGADLGEAIAEVEIAKYAEWSGLLPNPESFARYPEYAQRAMVEWNNANTIGGSKRMDKIVDSAIKEVHRDTTFSFVLNLVFAIATLIAFVLTGSAWSYGMLAVPGISIAINLAKEKKGDREKQ